MVDEIYTLCHDLTDLHLENKAGISSKIRFKMDTGASGNLMPISTYIQLFPNHIMKDLGMAIGPNVKLLIGTKSLLKQIIPEGQIIWYRNNVKNIWEKGTVVDRDEISGRSYILVGENGKILFQNCIDLNLSHTSVSHRNMEAKVSPPISNIPNIVKSTTLSSTSAKKGNVNKSATVSRFGYTMKPPNRIKY